MQKLRGSGNTFSTSGKRWTPFRYSVKVARQNAKRWRLVRKGLTGNMTKDQMRQLIAKHTYDFLDRLDFAIAKTRMNEPDWLTHEELKKKYGLR